MEDDNPRQFDRVKHRAVNVKNANFDWTRIAMSLKFHYLFHFGLLGPTLLSLGDFGGT